MSSLKFTMYETATGRVLFGGTADDVTTITPNGATVHIGEIFESGWISEGVHFAQPPQPDTNHVFSWYSKQWEDPRTLEDLQALKWTEVKQARTQAEFGTFIYNGMEFDGDLDAQRRLASYISVSKSAIVSGMPFQAEFILANDSVVPLTAQDFVGIEMAKVQQVAAAFAHAVQLRARIDAATTKEEVEAVVW